VSADGDIGLGTTIPQARLHVQTTLSEGIRINRLNAAGGPQAWESLVNGPGEYGIIDVNTGRAPFLMAPGALSSALFLGQNSAVINGFLQDYNFEVSSQTASAPLIFADAGTKHVGIGTATPTAPLHILRNDGTAGLLIEDTGNANGNLSMMQLTNRSGRARMQFTSVGNASQTGDWSISSGLTFVLQERLEGKNVFVMDNAGNLAITGELTTAGSCAAGCDRVFDADYALPSIADHQAAMWKNGYLPNVGPTAEDAPFNVSDKMGRMLNELEHAHIFIGQQEKRIAVQESEIEALDEQVASLAAKNALRDRQIDDLLARLVALEN
jgi:uncharacterized coiled-coil protein SlyX